MSVPEKITETTWICTLEEDPETGELVMPLPDELLASQGWVIGDVLTWDFDTESGTATLKKEK